MEGSCKPLWPVDDFDRILVAKIYGQLTAPFKYSEPMCTLLALKNNDVSLNQLSLSIIISIMLRFLSIHCGVEWICYPSWISLFLKKIDLLSLFLLCI